MVWCSHLFETSPQSVVIHTIKGFGVVNKAEIDVFLELSHFFDDPADVGNLTSGFSAFSKQLEHLEVHSSHTVEARAWRILSILLLVCEMTATVQ